MQSVVLGGFKALFEIVESKTGKPVESVMVVVRMKRAKMRPG